MRSGRPTKGVVLGQSEFVNDCGCDVRPDPHPFRDQGETGTLHWILSRGVDINYEESRRAYGADHQLCFANIPANVRSNHAGAGADVRTSRDGVDSSVCRAILANGRSSLPDVQADGLAQLGRCPSVAATRATVGGAPKGHARTSGGGLRPVLLRISVRYRP